MSVFNTINPYPANVENKGSS